MTEGDLPERRGLGRQEKIKLEDKQYWQQQPLMTSAQQCQDEKKFTAKRLMHEARAGGSRCQQRSNHKPRQTVKASSLKKGKRAPPSLSRGMPLDATSWSLRVSVSSLMSLRAGQGEDGQTGLQGERTGAGSHRLPLPMSWSGQARAQ